ncbi:hypothetical protein EG328_005655 [Venturia inaequalis]|uniref:Uncharacterized protein n=1 Tax=Venturia inaequalis TaxID=5025 RepID=A0A8H3VVC2_VENIN|nr:hypothetical protein EG328_005655 [Venturia inaequalis]KAE9994875.1 hypothetical protein EG327_000089 [Venturia inaequalis]
MASHISEKPGEIEEVVEHESISTPAAEEQGAFDVVADAANSSKDSIRAPAERMLALVNGSDSSNCLHHGAVMALSPVHFDREQLPLERFLTEGTAEQCSIFVLDGAIILSTHELCTCETVGPELEVGHDSDGEDGASKVRVLLVEYNGLEELARGAGHFLLETVFWDELDSM